MTRPNTASSAALSRRSPLPSALAIRAMATLAPRTTAEWAARRFLEPRRVPARPAELAILESSVPGVASVRGRAIRTHRWGDGGPTAILAHGWSGSAAQMTALVDPLRTRGFTVVAFDAPAHGASDGRNTDVSEMADALRAVASTLDDAPVIVAHSLGATAAAIAMGRGLAVRALALITPAPGPRSFAEQLVDGQLALPQQARDSFFAAIEARVGVTFDELEIEAVAGAVRCPTLVVHDADDKVVGAAPVRRVLQALPHARAILTHGLGHHRVVRDGAVIEAVVDHLDDAPSVRRPRTALRDRHLEAIVGDVAFGP